MAADTVTALGKVEDDKASPKGTAQFYLQLDDEKKNILQVIYDKEKDNYSIQIFDREIDNIEDYGGTKQLDG